MACPSHNPILSSQTLEVGLWENLDKSGKKFWWDNSLNLQLSYLVVGQNTKTMKTRLERLTNSVELRGTAETIITICGFTASLQNYPFFYYTYLFDLWLCEILISATLLYLLSFFLKRVHIHIWETSLLELLPWVNTQSFRGTLVTGCSQSVLIIHSESHLQQWVVCHFMSGTFDFMWWFHKCKKTNQQQQQTQKLLHNSTVNVDVLMNCVLTDG